ncbi:hypothetical protein HII13_000875 [Brettanomyces bruxellensis]|nr:hypothetical protein HII13_000875 [Brettanomyces bruxellensis]
MSFDPVHDSIEANRTEPNGTKSPSAPKGVSRTTFLTSLLNPESNDITKTDEDNDAQFSDSPSTKKSQISSSEGMEVYVTQPKISDLLTTSPSSSSKRRRYFIKETPQETKYKEYHGYQNQTLLINSRTRHLKKEDGEPYWRSEIQFEFLLRLFLNDKRVFHNPYYGTEEGFVWPEHFKFVRKKNGAVEENDGKMLTFFELYLVTLLKSSKVSKILKDRLTLDINYALNFSVICLLVNVGRLNTTVNFDYEMKSQFRTYHPIPSLQVGSHLPVIERYYRTEKSNAKLRIMETYPDGRDAKMNASSFFSQHPTGLLLRPEQMNVRGGSGYTMSTVKQLQDTPRIKSILKSFISGSSKDDVFDLNIISLIFLLSAHEAKICQAFFPIDVCNKSNNVYDTYKTAESQVGCVQVFDDGQSKFEHTTSLFNDIWLKPEVNPEDKVQRFLWLIYFFKETNCDVKAMSQNPFNRSQGIEKFSTMDANFDIAKGIVNGDNFVLSRIRALVPDFHKVDENLIQDPLLNDVDTKSEIAFGNRMKKMRLEFVENERTANHLPKSLAKNETTVPNAEVSSSTSSSINTQNHSSNSVHQATQVSPASFSPASNTFRYYKRSSSSVVEPQREFHLPSSFDADQSDDNTSKRRRIRHRTSAADLRLRQELEVISTTPEAGSLSPQEFKEIEEEYERDLRHRKKRTFQVPLRLDRVEMEKFLNSEIKAINTQSKNATGKRHRNNVYALFIKDLLDYKMEQLQCRRMKMGNIKEIHQIDPNMFLKASIKEISSVHPFGDFGEFKVHYFKELSRINDAINHRELSKIYDTKTKHEQMLRNFKESTLFIDEAVKKLHG